MKNYLRHREANEGDLPLLPPGRESYFSKAHKENKKILTDTPWTRGLLENILAADTVLKAKLQNKNRFALTMACDILNKLHGLTFEFSKYAKFLKEMSSEVLEDEDED